MNRKVALVTGASRGIGRAIAEDLAATGCFVYVNYSSNAEAAAETVAACEARGGAAKVLKFNVANSAEVEHAVKVIKDDAGKLDILVNNAGITANSLLLRTKDSDWDRVLDINLKGVFLCCRAAAKLLLKSEAGRIVNVGSVVAEMGNPGQVAYVASKAGVLGLTKSLAKELASRSVTVNAVTPGFISTDMTGELSEEQRSRYLEAIPLGSFGSAEDVAQAVCFLCSDGARYITGQVLGVNGGMYM